MMDAHRSPTRRIVISGYDGRTGIDLARTTYSPPAAAADYSKINGAFSDSPKQSGSSPSVKRRARAASHPAPRAKAARPSMLQNLIDLIGHDGAAALVAALAVPAFTSRKPPSPPTCSAN
jgi:hypothetical protein